MNPKPRHIAIAFLLLALLAAGTYFAGRPARERTKETLLKQNLFTLRTVIDEYTFDKKAAPQRLDDLVNEGYLREIPADPLTGTATSWHFFKTASGEPDVRSGSNQLDRDGTPYNQW